MKYLRYIKQYYITRSNAHHAHTRTHIPHPYPTIYYILYLIYYHEDFIMLSESRGWATILDVSDISMGGCVSPTRYAIHHQGILWNDVIATRGCCPLGHTSYRWKRKLARSAFLINQSIMGTFIFEHVLFYKQLFKLYVD